MYLELKSHKKTKQNNGEWLWLPAMQFPPNLSTVCHLSFDMLSSHRTSEFQGNPILEASRDLRRPIKPQQCFGSRK
uniref:Uncharacterized protein n=1 Tax=Rhizophora mucronata TaxID=61149 RepID=A0A2P2JUX2_RHIMU